MGIVHQKMRLISYGLGDAFDPTKFIEIRNQDHSKPLGGLWASPVGSLRSWKAWCEDAEFDVERLQTSFTFDYEGLFFQIDSFQDMLDLPWRNVYDESIWFLDYEELKSMQIDAVWLTPKGLCETRFSYPKSLYSWDCESVLIIKPSKVILYTAQDLIANSI